MYKLYFDDGKLKKDKKLPVIGEYEEFKDCMKKMDEMLAKGGIKPPYYKRFIELEDGRLWIDFGSWSQFFYIGADGKKLTLEDIKDGIDETDDGESDQQAE